MLLLLWLSTWLPLDLTTATSPSLAGGLQVDAVLQGRRVAARLTNVGHKPLDVLVGYTCGGPEPFVAIVDGVSRSFQTGMIVCTGNAMVLEHLLPGASRLVPSQTLILDGAAHELVVRYHSEALEKKWWSGTLTSSPLTLTEGELDVTLRATPKSDGAVELELVHRWHGHTNLRFLARWIGVCARPHDALFVDEKPNGYVENACAGPAAAETETVSPGQAFTNRATIHLARGWHRLRARYRVTAEDMRLVFFKGNIGDWLGEVETPEIEVRVP